MRAWAERVGWLSAMALALGALLAFVAGTASLVVYLLSLVL